MTISHVSAALALVFVGIATTAAIGCSSGKSSSGSSTAGEAVKKPLPDAAQHRAHPDGGADDEGDGGDDDGTEADDDKDAD